MSTKIKEFVYNEKPRRVYEMVSDESQLGGIDIAAMDEESQRAFEVLIENFETALTPYIKSYYRRFARGKIQPLQ